MNLSEAVHAQDMTDNLSRRIAHQFPTCVECGKSRKAHYDNLYCYAATRTIVDRRTGSEPVAYVFPITEYTYKI